MVKIIGTAEEIEYEKDLHDKYCTEDCDNCCMNHRCGEQPDIEYEVLEEE